MPCFFIALKYLPTSQCHIILSTNPLLNAILAYFVLSEILRVRDIFFLIGAFIGVFIINTTKISNLNIDSYEDYSQFAIILCLISLCFRATAGVSMKQITNHVNSVYSPFYFSIGIFLNAIVLLVFFRDFLNIQFYDSQVILLLGVSSLTNYAAQSLMSLASKYEKATVLAPMSYLTTSMILVVDIVIFQYEFMPLYFVGFVIILV
mmetsp:Transcript_26229/g.23214  ORF Transcript_26229/g.23214 Transcript_26229/m.23214 type:complete len:206 (+) Transcript_26229:395-1012(+)